MTKFGMSIKSSSAIELLRIELFMRIEMFALNPGQF